MKTPTLTVNGVDRQPVSTNGSALRAGRRWPGHRCRPGNAATGWTALGGVLVIGIAAAFGYLYSSRRVEGTGRGRSPRRSRSVR